VPKISTYDSLSRLASLAWLAWLSSTAAGPLAAHDFWIEPGSFAPAIGDRIALHLRVGEGFAGEPVPRNPQRIERFAAIGPGGAEIPAAGEPGADPAGSLQLTGPGLHIAVYRSTPAFIELEAAKFEEYLRQEGLEPVLDERRRRGEQSAPGRELYSRSVKALLSVGGTGGLDRALGLPLELVAESDPQTLAAAGELAVRLLFRGAPLAGAQVVALPKQGAARQVVRRTDAEGRVAFPLAVPGPWLIKAVHMVRLESDPRAQWESVWASLTFAGPNR